MANPFKSSTDLLLPSLTGDDLRGAVVGEGTRVEPGAVLNYPTGRPIAVEATRLGRMCVIRTGTVIYTNVVIGDRFQSGHGCVIREENIIGDDCNLWSNSCIDYGCRIGQRVMMHNNVYVAQFTVIEDDVFVGPGVSIANDKYPVDKRHLVGPTIRRGATIGAGAVLLPGVEIGENALVGAGAVVTKNVPPGKVVAGNPARIIGDVATLYAARKPAE